MRFRTKNSWSLSPESWDRLLGALASDPDSAAREYETLRRKLLMYFGQRRIDDPDSQADIVFDRLARKIEEGVEIREPHGYALGIARLVLLEAKSTAARKALNEPELRLRQSQQDEPDPDAQEMAAYLEKCLALLDAATRTWLVDYYSDSGKTRIERRERIARELGVGMNALRIRACRFREELRSCVGKRLAAATQKLKHFPSTGHLQQKDSKEGSQ